MCNFDKVWDVKNNCCLGHRQGIVLDKQCVNCEFYVVNKRKQSTESGGDNDE